LPIYFESGGDTLLVSTMGLNLPNKLGAGLEKNNDDSSLNTQIGTFISQQLSEGIPTIDKE
jgi:hypothetical protein